MIVSGEPAALLAGSGPVLLDFDGPVCKIFSGVPAPHIAAQLVALLGDLGAPVNPEVSRESDPLAVLRWTGALNQPNLTRAVEDELCRHEERAVQTAAPNPHGHGVIRQAVWRDKAVAIVSNNSRNAIKEYLSLHNLDDLVSVIVGRPYSRPAMMKPNPEPIMAALRKLAGGRPAFVGDSLFDIEAAKQAHVPIVAYANRHAKVELFTEADAEAVVTSMEDVLSALMVSSPHP